MIIKTDYGSYDDECVESMLNYCCKIRGNSTELISRTIYEFNWFIEVLECVPVFPPCSLRELKERERIVHMYSQWFDDTDATTLVKLCRMFVDYCISEYCND